MIRATGLGRSFGDLWAVRGMDLEVLRGEVLGLLGPNGAGKTTTVRMLTALIEPTEGTASVDGLDVVEQPEEVRARVGILTETPGLYDKLSATANLDFFGRLYGLDAATRAARIERYLRLFSLWDRRDDVAGTFSKGMKQKLAIARALLHEPAVVFLDEPTAALDPEAAYVVREAIEIDAPVGPDDRARHAQPRRGGPAVRPGRVRPRRAAADRFAGRAARLARRRAASRSAWPASPARRVVAAARAVPGVTARRGRRTSGCVVAADDPAGVAPGARPGAGRGRRRHHRPSTSARRRSSRSTSRSWAPGPTAARRPDAPRRS